MSLDRVESLFCESFIKFIYWNYTCSETSVIQHLDNPIFSLIQTSDEVQSPHQSMLIVTP